MKYILLTITFIGFVLVAKAQLVGNGFLTTQSTNYTDGNPNDLIYIWCSDDLTSPQGSLTATPTSGVGPYTFDWFYYNEASFSWTSLSSSVGAQATLNNLPSDGYRVQIYDNGGNLVDCMVTWVWNLATDIQSITSNETSCDLIALNAVVNSNSTFTYYNVPPPESLITSNTQITVCFDANHTFVSDVGFYLVSPPTCGSSTVLLSPNPGANGQGSVCNGGSDINNLCFTSTPSANLDVCTASVPLTGTYSSYGATNTPISWASLYGCNANQGGWAVQIYDCIGADVGALTNATITFSNLTSICGSPTSVTYDSGNINSAINDNSCSPESASIFNVPLSSVLTTPINLNANVSLNWSSSDNNILFSNPQNVNTDVSNFLNGETTYYLETELEFNGEVCSFIDSVIVDVIDVIQGDTIACSQVYQVVGTETFGNFPGEWSSPNLEISFSNVNVLNPIITATAPGVYDIVFTTCRDILSFQLTIPFQPSIFSDTTICDNSFQIPLDSIESFGGGFWQATNPGTFNFSPSAGVLAPLFSVTQFVNYQLTFTDSVCGNSAIANISFANPPAITVPEVSCFLQELTITSNSFDGGTWTILDNPTTPFLEDTATTFINSTNNQSANPEIAVSHYGNYTIQFTDNYCGETVTDVLYFPPYIYTEIADTNICIGVEYQLGALVSPYDVEYTWSTGATGVTSILVSTPGVYTVTIENECYTFSDDAIIQTYLCDIEAPNVISLSSKAGNETWYVQANGIADFECIILNRWGNLIYEFSDINAGWNGQDMNGRLVEDGVYFYTIKAKAFGGEEVLKHGSITVVR